MYVLSRQLKTLPNMYTLLENTEPIIKGFYTTIAATNQVKSVDSTLFISSGIHYYSTYFLHNVTTDNNEAE